MAGNNDAETLGGRIRSARLRKGYKSLTKFMEAVEQKTGFKRSKAMYSGIERNSFKPGRDFLAAIAQTLEFPVEHFLAGASEEVPTSADIEQFVISMTSAASKLRPSQREQVIVLVNSMVSQNEEDAIEREAIRLLFEEDVAAAARLRALRAQVRESRAQRAEGEIS